MKRVDIWCAIAPKNPKFVKSVAQMVAHSHVVESMTNQNVLLLALAQRFSKI